MGGATGETTKNFAKAAGLDTPAGVMSILDKFLTGMTQPVSWDQAKKVLDGFVRNIAPGTADAGFEKTIEDRMHHYVNADGNLDRAGLVRFVADSFNDISVAQQDPRLVKQASDMLVRLGIDDPTHSLANGLSKLSSIESKYMRGELNPADPVPGSVSNSPYQTPKR
jgi:hypothetical protein